MYNVCNTSSMHTMHTSGISGRAISETPRRGMNTAIVLK